jgi:quercetin dioxygenase-like cupin family protein
MSETIKKLLEMVEMPKEGILSVAVEDNEHYKVVLFLMPAGQYISPHTSTMPATVQIIKGSADFTLGENAHRVSPGDFFYMPPDFNHAVKAVEDLVFLLHLKKVARAD